MNPYRWITDEAARKIESELLGAFPLCDSIVEEERYKQVREEIFCYYPDDMLGALPFMLLGFLRFGAASVKDTVELCRIVHYLNITNHPWDDPSICPDGNPEWERLSAQSKEEAVSLFSARQACAIILWLDAIRGSQFFSPDDDESRDLDYAIAYWSARSKE